MLSSEITKISLALIGLAVVAVNVYGVIASARIAADAAREAKEVKETLRLSTATTDSRLAVIHRLVNNDMTVALREKASALRRVAILSGDPNDLRIATVAEDAVAARINQAASQDAMAAVAAVSQAISSQEPTPP